MIEKIRELVFKDVKNENETKTTAVSLRIHALIMASYFVCLFAVFCVEKQFGMAELSALCLGLYVVAFMMTYMNNTHIAIVFMELQTIFWIIAFITQLGWESGAQQFILALLLLVLTPNFIPIWFKLVNSVLLLVLRMSLFMYTRNYVPAQTISSDIDVVFQIINTFFVFVTLIAAMMMVSYDSARMDEKLMKYNKKLHRLASEDPLTGLSNRRSLLTYLQDYQARNTEEIGPSVAIADLDHFKMVNDTYGHEAGDEVLKAVATFFQEYMEGKGVIGRWGGEEFLFVFTNCNLDDAGIYMTEILDGVRKIEIPYHDQIIRVTMTIGVEECGGEEIEKTINAADKKLYFGKENGRNRVVC